LLMLVVDFKRVSVPRFNPTPIPSPKWEGGLIPLYPLLSIPESMSNVRASPPLPWERGWGRG